MLISDPSHSDAARTHIAEALDKGFPRTLVYSLSLFSSFSPSQDSRGSLPHDLDYVAIISTNGQPAHTRLTSDTTIEQLQSMVDQADA